MRQKKRSQPTNRYLAYGALLLATAIWGGATAVIKLTLDYIPLFTFLFYRFLIVCLILLPITYYELKRIHIKLNELPTFLLLGLTGQSAILLIFAGIKYTSAVDAAIIGTIAPIMIIAAGHYFYKDKISKKLEIGILIATIGTIFVVFEPAVTESGFTATAWERMYGNFLVVLYNVSFAAYIILSKKVMGKKSPQISKTLEALNIKPLSKNYSPFLHTSLSFYVALITFIPLAILEAKGYFGAQPFNIFEITPTPLLGLLYMAIISSIVAYFAFQWGLENARVSDTGVFAYLGPVFTVPFAYILLHEIPSSAVVIGTIIIAIGVYIAEMNRRHM
ncbi:MAG: DMT family transporter [Patescibacteria group bacterium]